MNDIIEIFVDQLMCKILLGYPQELTQEVKNELRMDYIHRIEDKINYEIISRMTKDQLEYFEKLLDSDNNSDAQAYMMKVVSNYDELVQEVLLFFRNMYIKTA